MAMEVESASLCNVVIKYLLDQQYLLTAFELMHELIEDGHSDRATRLQQLFSDTEVYPPEEILRLQNLQGKLSSICFTPCILWMYWNFRKFV